MQSLSLYNQSTSCCCLILCACQDLAYELGFASVEDWDCVHSELSALLLQQLLTMCQSFSAQLPQMMQMRPACCGTGRRQPIGVPEADNIQLLHLPDGWSCFDIP